MTTPHDMTCADGKSGGDHLIQAAQMLRELNAQAQGYAVATPDVPRTASAAAGIIHRA